ncbi:hypothetical protein BpHYR1_040433 [Brachionus plicatilis]|uniref:Uncharacterized protein n=1 Tax=Brachionus plicatilis TaxID=10195 RepID=A0A3M7QML8_BRAPC|nr:hypothetical protein BpHYR1_040433 [Brachionus plicatilis]
MPFTKITCKNVTVALKAQEFCLGALKKMNFSRLKKAKMKTYTTGSQLNEEIFNFNFLAPKPNSRAFSATFKNKYLRFKVNQQASVLIYWIDRSTLHAHIFMLP